MHDVFPRINGKEEEKTTNDVAAQRAEQQLQGVSSAPSIGEFLLIFRRRKWLVILLTCLGTALAALIAKQFEPQYTAEASIVIEGSSGVPIEGISKVSSALTADPETMATQVNLMLRPPFVGRIIDYLDLTKNPVFAPQESGLLSFASLGKLIDGITTTFQVSAGQPHQSEPLDLEPIKNADQTAATVDETAILKAFSKRFVVNQVGESQVINIAFTSPDPELAADIVNTAANNYVDGQLESKLSKVNKVEDWTSKRLDELEDEVRVAEAAIQTYRAEHGLAHNQASEARQAEQIELNRQLTLARAELNNLQSKIAMVQDLETRADQSAVTGVVSSPTMLQLQAQQLELERTYSELAKTYGANHPRMQLIVEQQSSLASKINTEITRMKLDLERQASLVQQRVTLAENDLEGTRTEGYRRGTDEIRLRELEREAEVARNLMQLFLEHYKSIDVQRAIIEPDAKVGSLAKPPRSPSSLSSKLYTILGFTISLTGSAILALLLEILDRKVRSKKQIERLFRVKALGAVGYNEQTAKTHKPHLYIKLHPRSRYAEDLRLIYAALRAGQSKRECQVIMIASALSGDGKTTFATSLATTAAQWRQKVLLIDLDLRHPSIGKVTGVTPENGIVEVIEDDLYVHDAVVRSGGDFDVLSVVHRPENPANLMSSDEMRQLFRTVREDYDWVFVDSAPMLAVSESRLIVEFVDRVVFCARWGKTPLSAIGAALSILRDSDATLAGAALVAAGKQHFLYENEDGADYQKNISKYYED
ncbi:MAG: GumC family protein [Geminicoccales bacterium]